jgi:hypothetical protein
VDFPYSLIALALQLEYQLALCWWVCCCSAFGPAAALQLAMALDISEQLDDIEDSVLLAEDSRVSRAPLTPAPPAVPHQQHATADDRARVPGVQSIWVKTFGCSHNQSDSEYMMGVLQAYGYRCSPCGRASLPRALVDTQSPSRPVMGWHA